MRNIVPELVERACEVRGWSQQQLAEHLGVGDATVSDWARGQAIPGPQSQEKLARALTDGEIRYIYPEPDVVRKPTWGQRVRWFVTGAFCGAVIFACGIGASLIGW